MNKSKKLNESSSSAPCTPPNTIGLMENNNTPKENPLMARIRRDLNSPSAAARLRAIKALR